MKKILIAVDGSEGSHKAVEFVGRFFSESSDLKITLLHVLPELPAEIWEEGHILSGQEKAKRKAAIDNWQDNQKLKTENIYKRALNTLTENGIEPQQVETKSNSEFADVAETILDEARNGGYQVLILGRRGLSNISRFLMGSVTNKVIHHGTGLTLCIVE
ncbi:MAG: universal stress protein [Thermodesulfobacteriota bacterium]|nr:universal stress protein [Thermodesulfobacteriota bacterium]